MIVFFIGELFFYTWCRLQCVRFGYEISQETDRYQRQITLQKTLRIELVRLKSPGRIAKIAREKLGLTMPDPGQMIIIP